MPPANSDLGVERATQARRLSLLPPYAGAVHARRRRTGATRTDKQRLSSMLPSEIARLGPIRPAPIVFHQHEVCRHRRASRPVSTTHPRHQPARASPRPRAPLRPHPPKSLSPQSSPAPSPRPSQTLQPPRRTPNFALTLARAIASHAGSEPRAAALGLSLISSCLSASNSSCVRARAIVSATASTASPCQSTLTTATAHSDGSLGTRAGSLLFSARRARRRAPCHRRHQGH